MNEDIDADEPSEAFVGEPVQVTREMSDEEAYLVRQEQRRKEFEERVRLAEEREAKSLIPLYQDYESRIFNSRNIGWDCDIIAHLMEERMPFLDKEVARFDVFQ